jgi:hypothetical protein
MDMDMNMDIVEDTDKLWRKLAKAAKLANSSNRIGNS